LKYQIKRSGTRIGKHAIRGDRRKDKGTVPGGGARLGKHTLRGTEKRAMNRFYWGVPNMSRDPDNERSVNRQRWTAQTAKWDRPNRIYSSVGDEKTAYLITDSN